MGIAGGDLVKDFRAVHGLGPGLRGGESGEGSVERGALSVEFGAAFGDFSVQGFDPQSEAFGLGSAAAVVFGGAEEGEALEGRYIVELLHRYIVGKGGMRERRGPRMVEGWRVEG